jgi:hypothetical protein
MKPYKIISKYLVVLVLVLLFSSSIVFAGKSSKDTICDYTSLIIKYQNEIKKKMKRLKVRGISVALIDEDNVVWIEGFGYSDKENKIKAMPTTRYMIGSVTKLFTAMGVMQLQE